MTTKELSLFIKNEAFRLGFETCGIAKANQIPESERSKYNSWLEEKFHADMNYMTKNTEKRFDPRFLVEGCRSVIVVALNYEPAIKQNPEAPQIAHFAFGQDYHELIRSKLKTLLKLINNQGFMVHGRAFADSAPIAERYWASQAGLGWIGKNHHLIVPGKGSKFLLGELLVDVELDYDSPLKNYCGNCRRCLEECPTKALSESSGLNASLCLSYLTIEKRGPFNPLETALVGQNNYVFGCDRCQNVCPWNRFSNQNTLTELQPKESLLQMNKGDFEKLTEAEFNTLFAGTCLERTGYEGFLRNLRAK